MASERPPSDSVTYAEISSVRVRERANTMVFTRRRSRRVAIS